MKGPIWRPPFGTKSKRPTSRARSDCTPAEDERWTLATITDAGRKRMAEIAAEHSTDWQGLGVAILHRLLIDTLLAAGELPKPKYVHSVDEVIESLEKGDAAVRDATGVMGQGGRFELAALVMPATVEHIRRISRTRRTDAGQKHVLLSQARQRTGHQPADVISTALPVIVETPFRSLAA